MGIRIQVFGIHDFHDDPGRTGTLPRCALRTSHWQLCASEAVNDLLPSRFIVLPPIVLFLSVS